MAKLASTTEGIIVTKPSTFEQVLAKHPSFKEALDGYRFNEALEYVWSIIKALDVAVNNEKPWEKSGDERTQSINAFIGPIQEIATLLSVYIPETAGKILKQYAGPSIQAEPPLFPRLT